MMILDSASPLTLGLSAVAVFSYVWPALRVADHGRWATRLWVTLAWLTHGGLIVLGFIDAPARFGFAPALSVTAWLIATSYAVERQLYPQLPARWALSAVGAMLHVLNLDPRAEQWRASGDSAALGALGQVVELLLEERRDARANKDFAKADAIRDRLTAAGISIEDAADTTHWSLDG